MKTSGMSSYPIVLKDKFCIIIFSCPSTFVTFDSALAPGPMKAGKDWSANGPMRRADSAKTRWQNMPATRWMAFRSFAPSVSAIPSIARPVPCNLHTMRGKSPKISASVPRSGKRSPSRPLRIFPATEPKPGTHPRFLDTDVFRDLVWAPAQESLGSKLGPFIFEFQRWGMEPAAFLEALDRFLGTLPPGPQ